MKETKSMRALVMAVCLLPLSPALRAQSTQEAPSPTNVNAPRTAKVVELTSDTCANLSERDSLAFEWNPGFDHPGSATGVNRVVLTFARRGEESDALQGHGGLKLVAIKSAPRIASTVSSIAALPNGFFRMTFLPYLHGVSPGEYFLIDARSDAGVDPSYNGPRPEMTNSPLRRPYCLNVVAPVAPASGAMNEE